MPYPEVYWTRPHLWIPEKGITCHLTEWEYTKYCWQTTTLWSASIRLLGRTYCTTGEFLSQRICCLASLEPARIWLICPWTIWSMAMALCTSMILFCIAKLLNFYVKLLTQTYLYVCFGGRGGDTWVKSLIEELIYQLECSCNISLFSPSFDLKSSWTTVVLTDIISSISSLWITEMNT